MKIEAGKVYRDGFGSRAHIMGPTRRGDGVEGLWSLEGHHYLEDGRRIGHVGAEAAHFLGPPHALVEEIGTHDHKPADRRSRP